MAQAAVRYADMDIYEESLAYTGVGTAVPQREYEQEQQRREQEHERARRRAKARADAKAQSWYNISVAGVVGFVVIVVLLLAVLVATVNYTEMSDSVVELQQRLEELNDTEKKLKVLSELSGSAQNSTVYVYANGFEAHSDAAVDIRVSKRSKFADALVVPEQISNLPYAFQICRRMCEIARTNAVFAFVVKAILLFLSMTGYCNLWFVVFAEMAATVATQLHASQISRPSIFSKLKRHRQ